MDAETQIAQTKQLLNSRSRRLTAGPALAHDQRPQPGFPPRSLRLCGSDSVRLWRWGRYPPKPPAHCLQSRSEPLPGRTQNDRRRTGLRAERAAAQARAADSPQPSTHRALAARALAGARDAVLRFRGSAQQWLQARAGGHEPVPGRVQQPQARVPAAMRAGRDGGRAEAVPRRQGRPADPGESHAQPVLPAERRATAVHPADGRDEGSHRHAAYRRSPPPPARLAERRQAHARAAGPARQSHRTAGLRPLCSASSTTICRPGFLRSWRTSSSRSSRRCSLAGPRAASHATSPPTAVSPPTSRV